MPLVADFFADTDTQELTAACRKMPGDHGPRLPMAELADRRSRRSPSRRPRRCSEWSTAPGSRTARISCRGSPNGGRCSATTPTPSRRSRRRRRFFGTARRLGDPPPRHARRAPRARARAGSPSGRGGAGGSHVVPASRLQKDADDIYFQRWVEGRAISALFLANARQCRIIGFSEQWTAPAPRRPWRYGGAVRPASRSDGAAEELSRIVISAARASRLKGLASADFMLGQKLPYLIEINPRPGATLDIFAGAAKSLLRLHVDAVTRGRLPRENPCLRRGCGHGLRPRAKGLDCAAQHDLARLGGRPPGPR